MHTLRAAALSLLAVAPTVARADRPVVIDTLAAQVVALFQPGHESVRKQILGAARPDSLTEDQRMVVISTLSSLESSCRTDLFSKDAEPGSPSLLWRSLGRVDLGENAWYAAGLSCADFLCGDQLVLHDRVALLAIGRNRSRVILLPRMPATIGDPGTAVVDSMAWFRGDGYALLQVRRRLQSEHPCYGGGDYQASDEAYFFVLRGDSLAQSFGLVPWDFWGSHDDVDGDVDTERRATLRVTSRSVRMTYEVEERRFSPDGKDVEKSVIGRGDLHYEYRPKEARFKRIR
jgi:hypothetical protein